VVLPSIEYWDQLYGPEGTQKYAVRFFQACALLQPGNFVNGSMFEGALDVFPGLTAEEKRGLREEMPRYQHEAKQAGRVAPRNLPGFWQRAPLIDWKRLANRCPPTTGWLCPVSTFKEKYKGRLTIKSRYNAKPHCDKLPKKLPANTKLSAINKRADILQLSMEVEQPGRKANAGKRKKRKSRSWIKVSSAILVGSGGP